MTEADPYIPPQQTTIGKPRGLSWFRLIWWNIQLWWALRGPRRIIREATEDIKKSPTRIVEGTRSGEAYRKTGPPPEIPKLSPTLENAFHDAAADPRYTIVKPDIGAPVDVDLSKPLKGEEDPHA